MSPTTRTIVSILLSSSNCAPTNQTTKEDRGELQRSPEDEELEDDCKDRGGEGEDDEVPDGHEGDGSETGESGGRHQQTVERDLQPLGGCYGLWLGILAS